MQIEITGETERLIQAALATGKFASVEEFISNMTSDWKQRQAAISRDTLPPMPDRVELSTILTEQNVKPCTNPEDLRTDLWPSNESTDEFLAFLRESRRDRVESNGKQCLAPVPLSEIHSAMRGIVGKLSDDVCEGRNDRV